MRNKSITLIGQPELRHYAELSHVGEDGGKAGYTTPMSIVPIPTNSLREALGHLEMSGWSWADGHYDILKIFSQWHVHMADHTGRILRYSSERFDERGPWSSRTTQPSSGYQFPHSREEQPPPQRPQQSQQSKTEQKTKDLAPADS